MTDPRYMVLYACKWIARDAAKQFFKKDEVNPLSGLLIVLLHFSVFHISKKFFPYDFCPSTHFVQRRVLEQVFLQTVVFSSSTSYRRSTASMRAPRQRHSPQPRLSSL